MGCHPEQLGELAACGPLGEVHNLEHLARTVPVQNGPLARYVDIADAGPCAGDAQPGCRDELGGGWRRRAEAVAHLRLERVYGACVLRFREALHHAEPQDVLVDVLAGEPRVGEVEVEPDIHDFAHLLALQARDGAAEELAVEPEADGGDVPRLLRAK